MFVGLLSSHPVVPARRRRGVVGAGVGAAAVGAAVRRRGEAPSDVL